MKHPDHNSDECVYCTGLSDEQKAMLTTLYQDGRLHFGSLELRESLTCFIVPSHRDKMRMPTWRLRLDVYCMIREHMKADLW